MNFKALGIKLIVNIIIVFSIFGIFYNASLMNLFWVSILTTAITYFIGDLLILPRVGNTIATIADFGLAFLSLALLGSLFIQTDMPIVTTSLFTAFFIALCEPLLHAYMKEKGEEDKRHFKTITSQHFQTEFGEETEGQRFIEEKDPRRDPQK
ncbi:YndM family protein [Ornithinibacillus xuwenensis]|uniref:YndM family protein n=1 Tax=Ornithinibacillus xuwenensis TaxID=3144668 RepID=A0ABU9XJV6_9BACI